MQSQHIDREVLLCIDDDPAILEITQKMLEKSGYSVLTATNGSEALEIFRERRIDLVVVDYEMPGMKGHEVAAALKELNPHIPVVLQSAAPDLPAQVIQATDAYVPKGSASSVLTKTVANLITPLRSKSMPLDTH